MPELLIVLGIVSIIFIIAELIDIAITLYYWDK